MTRKAQCWILWERLLTRLEGSVLTTEKGIFCEGTEIALLLLRFRIVPTEALHCHNRGLPTTILKQTTMLLGSCGYARTFWKEACSKQPIALIFLLKNVFSNVLNLQFGEYVKVSPDQSLKHDFEKSSVLQKGSYVTLWTRTGV